MNVKVCGMLHEENIADIARLDIDYIGFIFYDKSPRHARSILSTSCLKEIPEHIAKIGVFVNEKIETIKTICDEYNLAGVQLHGHETPATCQALRDHGLQVIKVIHIKNGDKKIDLAPYAAVVDLFLLDTQVEDQLGGTGRTFDWSILDQIETDTPFLLSGGIDIQKSTDIKNIKHPQFVGVDINSRFEIEPGLKDVALIEEFIKKIK